MSTESTGETLLRFKGFTIDLQRRGLYRGVERIHLTPIPFKVLAFLAQRRGFIVSKHELLDAIWGGRRDENTVEQAIRQIRRALGDETDQPRFIRTIPAVGYSFIAEIEKESEPHPKDLTLEQREANSGLSIKTSRLPWISAAMTLGLVIGGSSISVIALRSSGPELAAASPTRITRSQTHILSPLLIDGKQIYFPQFENGRYSVAAVSMGGGRSSSVPTGLNNPELCDVSADGRAMLLRDLIHTRDELEPLYVQPQGGPARRVGNVMAYDAGWYPDARRILFSADGVVYATDKEGNSPQRLFRVPGNVFWFRWSPSGKELRFTVIDKANEATSIWEAGADRIPHRLFPDLNYHLCCGSWTPDGKYFLFQVRAGNTFQIWAQGERESQWLPLRSSPFPLLMGAMSYRGPVVGRDGRNLYVRAEAPKGELLRLDSKAGEFIPLLPSLSARTIAYSRDGASVAYTSLADNQLWRCGGDGTGCLQLTEGFKNTVMPRWSPDGRTIAFMGLRFTGDWEVYTVPGDGGLVRLLSGADRAHGYPDWSPDGQQITYSDVPPVSQATGVYVFDVHSHKTTTLPQSADYFFPRFSPDGRFLVAQHSGDLHLDLYEFATATWRALTAVPASYPSWSHSGKYVYFRSDNPEGSAVFRAAIASRMIELVVNLGGVDRGPFIFGDWVGLTPDDSPIAVRNSTIEDIYAWNLVAR